MVQANSLTLEFYAGPRDERILGAFNKPRMNLLANISQRGARRENKRLVEVRFAIWTLQVDPYEIQSLPDPFREHVHVQALLRRYGHEISSNLFLHYREILLVDQVHLV